jgi:nicotinamidase-related amidase
MTFSASRFAPGRAAGVVVDVQNDFCHPDGACAARGSDVADAVAMVPTLEGFLDDARAAGVLVVFIQTTHDETTDSPAWLSRTGDREAGAPNLSSNCRTGTWGAEFYEVAPQEGEPVVIKHRYSAFAGTNLDVVLRTAGVDSLLLTGVSTNVCVESTLRDGLFAEYHVTLVEDCAASFERDAHQATVDNVAKYFGAVATSKEISATWSTLSQVA